MIKWMLTVVCLVAMWAPPAFTGGDDPVERLERQNALLRAENETLKKRIHWLEYLRRFRPGRTSASRTDVFRIGRGEAPADHEHLDGIRLAKNPTKEQVRAYVARILAATAAHREIFSAGDPEVELLSNVGSRNVAVLIEPLMYVPGVDGSCYLVDALKLLVREEHKQLILSCLPKARELVDLVAAMGWAEAAAPTLLRDLAKRSPDLELEWVEAAARVARPESYDDLRFQLANGSDPLRVWLAIRELPGMEPLDAWIGKVWRSTKGSKDSWKRCRLAAVAAYYGHLDALEVLVRNLGDRVVDEWLVFQGLTGFGVGRDDFEREKDAQKWFLDHEDHLVYDRSKRRYEVAK